MEKNMIVLFLSPSHTYANILGCPFFWGGGGCPRSQETIISDVCDPISNNFLLLISHQFQNLSEPASITGNQTIFLPQLLSKS